MTDKQKEYQEADNKKQKTTYVKQPEADKNTESNKNEANPKVADYKKAD